MYGSVSVRWLLSALAFCCWQAVDTPIHRWLTIPQAGGIRDLRLPLPLNARRRGDHRPHFYAVLIDPNKTGEVR